MPTKKTQVLKWREVEQIRRMLEVSSQQLGTVLADMQANHQTGIRVRGVGGALERAMKLAAFANEVTDAWSSFETIPGEFTEEGQSNAETR